MNPVERENPVIDRQLDRWTEALGKDALAYCGHAYRVYHYCRLLVREPDEDTDEKIAVAAVYHDLGIWTHGTMDYLGPSLELVARYLETEDRSFWIPEVQTMIENHHKLRPYRNRASGGLVECFRRADLVDLTGGRIRFGIDLDRVRAIKSTFPANGFYRRLVGLLTWWSLMHPLRPLPMMKW